LSGLAQEISASLIDARRKSTKGAPLKQDHLSEARFGSSSGESLHSMVKIIPMFGANQVSADSPKGAEN